MPTPDFRQLSLQNRRKNAATIAIATYFVDVA
jgi:hypothetical protein